MVWKYELQFSVKVVLSNKEKKTHISGFHREFIFNLTAGKLNLAHV